MRKRSVRTIGLGAGLVLVAALVAGFGVAQAATGRPPAVSPLQKACGSKIVVQTDWFPEPEHGALYQLAGTNGTVDAKKGWYTGQIGKTGVSLEIRAGGPFTGFQQPISQMYQDSSITLGYVNYRRGRPAVEEAADGRDRGAARVQPADPDVEPAEAEHQPVPGHLATPARRCSSSRAASGSTT